jgi:hypothetical protein
MALASGKYLARTAREVVVWPAPDANGDAEEVWEPRVDSQGRSIGQERVKDAMGTPVRAYRAPEGFQNIPSYDHKSNYVKVDTFGQIVRQPNGEAICIKPGQALVFEPDGSVNVLDDEYAQYLFGEAHDAVTDEVVNA